MKVEYINPFVQASMSVIEMMLGLTPVRGNLTARPEVFTTQQVNIVCGVTGGIQGQVIYGMSMMTADKIASRMLGQPVVTFDKLAASAIAELGNMISGNSITLLASAGFTADITPPTIIRGSNVKITTLDIPAIVIQMNIPEVGLLEINVSIKEAVARAVAA